MASLARSSCQHPVAENPIRLLTVAQVMARVKRPCFSRCPHKSVSDVAELDIDCARSSVGMHGSWHFLRFCDQSSTRHTLITQAVTHLNRIKQLSRACQGSTTPECAILTLVVFLAAIAAIGSLGQVTSTALSTVGIRFGDAPNEGQATQLAGSPTAVRPAHGRASRPEFMGLLNLVALAITVAWLMFRNRPQRPCEPRRLATEGNQSTSDQVAHKRQQICRRLYNNSEMLMTGDIEIRHVMSGVPMSVRPNDSIERARSLFREQESDYLVVCAGDGKLAGLLSHYYVSRTNAKRVADAMMPKPLFVTAETMLSPTVSQMLNEGVSCVAVLEGDRPIGIVTVQDIQLTFQAALQVLARTSSELATEPSPMGCGASVDL